MISSKDSNRTNGRKRRFWALLFLSFVAIFLFNYLTPMFSDDYTYGAQVQGAHSLGDLFAQEYEQYMTWIGRSVVHMILRISLALPAGAFKAANSLVFVILTLLIYDNVRGKGRYNGKLLLFVTLLVWLTGVDFAQTVLWQTGACNYLWGTTIILGMLTLARREYERVSTAHFCEGYNNKTRSHAQWQKSAEPAQVDHGTQKGKRSGFILFLISIGFLLYGMIAGWCNENTSGALVLVLLALNFLLWTRSHTFSVPLFTGLVGSIGGLYMMVSAPGNANRAQYSDENYSGLAGYIARFEKLTEVIEDYFFPLLCLFLVLLVVSLLQHRAEGKRKACRQLRLPLGWLFLSLITSFALVMAPSAMPRAHFGAGIFLIIGVCQLAVAVVSFERAQDGSSNDSAGHHSYLARAGVYSLLGLLSLHFLFVYIEDGTDLFRIHRDCAERVSYIEEQKAVGSDDITVAQVHPAFYNKYSAIEIMDLEKDPEYWTNVGFEQYFDVSKIRAIPYDEWAEEYRDR